MALFDSCVFFSAFRRGLFMRLAMSGLFRARWTRAIHREWIDAVARRYPDVSRSSLEQLSDKMDEHAEGSLVSGFEGLIDGFRLPDQNDRHVLAAAVHGGADLIVTLNLRHFPPELLAEHGLSACHPDEFAMDLLMADSTSVLRAVRADRASLTRPAYSAEEYILRVQSKGEMPVFARALHEHIGAI